MYCCFASFFFEKHTKKLVFVQSFKINIKKIQLVIIIIASSNNNKNFIENFDYRENQSKKKSKKFTQNFINTSRSS